MKIKKIKWSNHPVLGNLELDLANILTGAPFDTIVLAGENGVGKTTILEGISAFLNLGSFQYFDCIEYVVSGKVYKAVQPSDDQVIKDFFDIVDDTGSVLTIRSNRNSNRDTIGTNPLDLRSYGCVFSKARADYKTQKITSTTTKNLDVDKYDTDSEDDFTALKQLIVDIQNRDNSEYAGLNKGLASVDSAPMSWTDFDPSSKIFRFKNAFDDFFEKLKYKGIADNSDEKVVLFLKEGKEISIDKLSTGEKQIVFRGIYLLKNSGELDGAAVMIDEPELSMHPKWQRKILGFYKKLFTNGESQIAQLFFATHSDHVLEDALSNNEKDLVIVLNDINGVIQAKKIDAPSVLRSITSAETNYLAFDIVSNDYHIQLYGYLQDRESRNSVKSCDDYIKNHADYNSAIHRKTSSHGTTSYDTLCTYIRNAIHHPDPARTFDESELRTSIELLIQLCR
jgi:predicted ATP-binding protein involved in virulence